MKTICRVVTIVGIISIIIGLFGCKNEPEYTVADIKSFSVSCGSMDNRQSYSFKIFQESDSWIFCGECITSETENVSSFEKQIKNDEAEKLLNLVENSNLISVLFNYRKPFKKIFVSDETSYFSTIVFSDGFSVSAPIFAGQDIERTFRSLAENTVSMR